MFIDVRWQKCCLHPFFSTPKQGTIKKLTQHIALVTGAMGGIGTAVCVELAKAGHKVVAALVAGNSVALLVDGASAAQGEQLLTRLRAAGLPTEALLVLPGAAQSLEELLDDERLAGVCLLNANSAEERNLLRQMAADDGAIRPLISAQELFDVRQQYRFSTEQTLTINTAAAGGNAALLAGMH